MKKEKAKKKIIPTQEFTINHIEIPTIAWERQGTNTKEGAGISLAVKGHTLAECYAHFVQLKKDLGI